MTVSELTTKLAGANVLGIMRVRNESERIRQSIASQLPICDKILVLDDHSTDSTRDILRGFGERVAVHESTFEGVNEGRDKEFLLAAAIAVNPEWVLFIDGDEVLEALAPVILKPEMASKQACAYSLHVIYFWDHDDKYRVDGVYANLHRASLFRLRGQPHDKLHFLKGRGEANLHNGGNCPQGLVGDHHVSGCRIKHYGYMRPEERQRKYELYNRIDPNNEAEDCYRHIIEIPGARHAPGPTRLEHWVEWAPKE